MRALSLIQPWCAAVLFGGKRVENRLKWKGSNFRGEFLLHASARWSDAYARDVVQFLEQRNIAWRPNGSERTKTGGIVGLARVVDVVMPHGVKHAGEGHPASLSMTHGMFTGRIIHDLYADPYYMGGFALVLADVRVCDFIPLKGALGFFRVPDDVAAKALASAKAAS